MNRRAFLAGAGTGVAGLSAGYAGARVADVRPYDPEAPDGDAPRERIVAAARHAAVADHREVTTVEVRRGPTGEAPYRLERLLARRQPSRRRSLHAFTVFDAPPLRDPRIADAPGREYVSPQQSINALLHYDRATSDGYDLPLTMVLHRTDESLCFDFDAPEPTDGDVEVAGRRGPSGVAPLPPDAPPTFPERIRPHRAGWELVADAGSTTTYRVAGADAYSQVVPLSLSPVARFGDPWVRTTLDRETGRLRRVVDHRDVWLDLFEGADPVRFTYRIETAYDRYGEATAPRPGGVSRGLDERLRGTLGDLLTY